MKRIRIPELVDLLALAGLAVLAAGVAMYSLPAALIVVGALMLVYAVLASRNDAGGTP